ncbi:hypothetical protein E4K72_05625 [Oxalobacteraceae bacterium OM1]|nr:hypothetical protein E4K72_05625 [Oxalobacteraceae bacterium OM1]
MDRLLRSMFPRLSHHILRLRSACLAPFSVAALCRLLGVLILTLSAGATAWAQTNGATFVSQSVPTSMTTGQQYTVSVTMKNTGTSTWTAANNYLLGSQNPFDNTTWGMKRVSLGTSVAPGSQYTFTFTVTAPSTAGTYNFQWGMVQEFVQWFGGASTNVPITVSAPPPVNAAQFVSQSVPTTMVPGQTYTASVTYKNTGNTTWTAAGNYRLGSQNPIDNTTWTPSNRVQLSGSVAPGQSYTFSFPVTAPSSGGTYNFQWQMVQDFVAWFGPATTNVPITVLNPPTISVSRSPSPMIAGEPFTVSWSTTNATSVSYSCSPASAGGYNASGSGLAANSSISGTASAAWAGTSSTCTWTATGAGGSRSYTETVTTAAAVNNAQFVSQSVPTTMVPGQPYTVSVTYKNTGNTTWTSARNYKLGPQNPIDNTNWVNPNRVAISGSVAPGQTYTFSYTVNAPSTPGTYNFQWGMVQDFVGWFGPLTTNVPVAVYNPPTLSLTRSPSPMIAGEDFIATWGTTNVTSVSYNCTPASAGGYNASASNMDPATGGVYGTASNAWVGIQSTCVWTATGPGGSKTLTETVNTSAPVNSAEFVSQSVPTTMAPGQTYNVSITYKNVGNTTWAPERNYRLGSQNPVDNTTWTTANRINLPGWVGPGNTYTFTFPVTAPTAPGTYNFQWQMVQDFVGWFGPKTTNVVVTVPQPPTISVSRTPMVAGEAFTANWSTTNATAVSYSCTPNAAGGYAASASGLAANSSVSGTASAAWVGNPSTCTWTATGPGGTKTYTETVTTAAAVNGAQFVSQTVPASMVPGQPYSVAVTYKNTGNTTWTSANNYKLGPQNPTDNTNWISPNRVPVSGSVAPGQTYTFNYTVNAPTTAGTYNFQWQLVQDYVGWFGDLSTNVAVPVAKVPTLAVTRTPNPMLAGRAYTLSWTSSDASSVAYNCTSTGSGFAGSGTLALNGATNGVADPAWIGSPTNCVWTASGLGGTTTVNETVSTVAAVNDATFVSQSVPTTLVAGQYTTVSVTMKNTGNTTWNATDAYNLGTQNPQNNQFWLLSERVAVDAPVPPGAQKTFTFGINAPTTPGTYNFQWKMVQEFVEWFGGLSQNVAVTVTPASSGMTATVTGTPTNTRVPSGQQATITFNGTGTHPASLLAKVDLLQDSGLGYAATPVKSVSSSNPSGTNNLALAATASVDAGVYRFKLRGTDTQGNIFDSAPVMINVTNSSLLGTVNGVRVNGSSTPLLNGWVCEDASTELLAVKLFMNAPTAAMGGTQVFSGVANVSGDPESGTVQGTCHTPGTGHHFNIDLSAVSATVVGGIAAGTPLYVQAQTAGGKSIILPCGDNNCTMPGSLRIALTTPFDGDHYQAPANVFMRAKLSNGTGPYDEIAFSINGEWIAGQPDTAADTYYASKSGLAASSTPYPVMAKVRQGTSTLYSMVNQIYVDGAAATTLTLSSPLNGATASFGTPITLTASVGGTNNTIASVKFFANGTLVGTATAGGTTWSTTWTNAAIGSYSVTASAYDAMGNVLAQSGSVTLTVGNGTGASSATPIPVVVSVPHLGNADAGSLAGGLAVGNGGAATYSMALPVPPGTAGLQPALSLAYSSNGGNGLAGLGWTLGGLSSIQRCGKTIAQDGLPGRVSFDTADRLCLDGMRLVRADGANPGTDVAANDAAYWAAGAQYRTEQETFARVTRLGNGGFKVEAKDGRTHYYGVDGNSAIAAVGRSDGQALAWALARTEDRSGNYLTVQYSQDGTTGEYLPVQIRYGGNSSNGQQPDLAVRFTYEARGDAQLQYVGGARNDLRSRLTHVKTYTDTAADGTGGVLVRDHTLHYTESTASGRSLVDWMQACATNPNTGAQECLPQTTFTWGSSGTLQPVALPGQPFALPMVGFRTPARFQGDFDGSGRTSFAAAKVSSCGAAGEPPCGDMTLHLDGTVRVRLPNGQVVDTVLNLAATGIQVNVGSVPAVMAGDLDGDGRDDLVLVDSVGKRWAYCLNTYGSTGAIGFNCAAGGTGIPSLIDLRNERKLHVVLPFDTSGNGTDCALVNAAMQCNPFHMTVTSGSTAMLGADTFQLTGVDLGRQAMSDLYFRWSKQTPSTDPSNPGNTVTYGLAVCYNKQGGLFCQGIDTGGANVTGVQSVGDVNGDGLTDFAYSLANAGAATGVYVCLSTENGVDCRLDSALTATQDVPRSFSYRNTVGNLLGDGVNRVLFAVVPRDDEGAVTGPGTSKLCRYTSSGMACQDFAYTPAADSGMTAYLDDSGVPSFVISTGSNVAGLSPSAAGPWDGVSAQNTTQQPGYTAVTLAGPPAQDRLVAVTNGIGQREEVDYARGDDSSVFARLATIDGTLQRPVYPKSVMAPSSLVKEMRRANGQGGWLRGTYRFEGSAIDVQGRGGLGFAKVQTTDQSSGISTLSILAQDYPYTGMALRSQLTSRSGVLLNDAQSTLDRQDFTLTSGGKTTFAFIKQSTATGQDLDGSSLATSTTTNTYGDGWGNLTSQSTTVSGQGQSATQTTTSVFSNDSTSWLIGRATSVTVTKSDPVAGSISRSTSFTYDPSTGLLQTESLEPGNSAFQLQTTYDRSGNMFGLANRKTLSWTDPSTGAAVSRTVSDITYDAKGRFAVTVKNALNQAETRSYHAGTGALLSMTGPNNLTTSWTVDGFGRTQVERRADGNETRQYFKQCQGDCPAGAVTASITDSFHGTDRIAVPSVVYGDSAGHVVRTLTWGFDGRTVVADQRFDSQGRLYEADQPRFSTDASRLAKRQLYDDLGRVTSVTTVNEAGAAQTATNQYQGLVTLSTNAKSQQRIETRDILGRVVQVMDAKAGLTQMTYDPFGNLVRTTDPAGNVVTVTYDKLGRKTDLRDPDSGWTHYDVDPLGQVWQQTNPVQRAAGTATRLTYDALGRLTARYEPDLESHWVFDTAATGIGQLAEAYTGTPTAKDYRRLHTYDSLGRPAQTTQVLFDGSYTSTPTYDAWGRAIRQTYQRGSDAAKAYDLRYNGYGYLARLERGSQVLWQVSTQDAAGRATQLALGNGLTQTRSYNPYSGRLEGAQLNTAANATRLQEGYQYDALGNVTQRTQYWDAGGFQEAFGYDELNRLTSSQVLGQAAQSFRYDSVGNLLGKTGVGTGDYSYPTPGSSAVRPHAVQSIPGIGSFGYDANGNLTSGAGRTVTWNSFDLPAAISKGSSSASFAYGPEHQRTRQSRQDGSVVVYAGAQEVERNASGTQVTVKTYWPFGVGVEIDRPNATTSELSWTHSDRLGSVVAISDATGALREKLAYDAWGKRRTTDGSSTPDTLDGQVDNRGFTGHEMLDQLDLVHMNGRVYDPLTARFMSADPFVQDPTNGQSYNRYAYVWNNPTNYTDPTGYEAVVEVVGSRALSELPLCSGSTCGFLLQQARDRAFGVFNNAFRTAREILPGLAKNAAAFAKANVVMNLLTAPGNALQNDPCKLGDKCAMDPATGEMTRQAYENQIKMAQGDQGSGAGAVSNDTPGTNSEGEKNGNKDGVKGPAKPGREKDVPDRGEPGEVKEGERRTREYGPDGRPLRDYDKPHQGYERPHVHEWPGGVREHPGRDYSPWPQQ